MKASYDAIADTYHGSNESSFLPLGLAYKDPFTFHSSFLHNNSIISLFSCDGERKKKKKETRRNRYNLSENQKCHNNNRIFFFVHMHYYSKIIMI